MYQIIEGDFRLEENGVYHAYGVKTGSAACINDVTVEFDKIRHFVESLNRFEASELHVMELIWDMLG